ncbi:MAG: sensor histidine kinase [bacterium]|nr:sensor histidine kinase [bacterium]
MYDSEIFRLRPRRNAAPSRTARAVSPPAALFIAIFAVLLSGIANPLAADCPNAVWRPGQSEINLKGDWRFQAVPGIQGANTAVAGVDYSDAGWGMTKLPGRVTAIVPASNLESGPWTVWYRCRVTLDGRPPQGLALYLGVVEHADAVYLNGVRVGMTGDVQGAGVDIEKRRLYPLPARFWRQGDNIVAIQVKAVSARSGVNAEPKLVNEQRQLRRIILGDTPAIIVCSIYILVAAFFGVFFLFFWNQIENLYFALFSLGLGVYNLIRTWLRYSYFESFEFSYQVELAILFTLPVLFMEFLVNLLSVRRPLLQMAVYVGYLWLFVATLILGANPAWWLPLIYTNLALLLPVIGLVYWHFRSNYSEQSEKLRYLLMGFIVILPFMLNDILDTLDIIQSYRVVAFGFVIFLGFAAMQLSNSILSLHENMKEQELGLRQLEKMKTRSIFNISAEFQRILNGFRDGITAIQNAATSKKSAAKKTGSRKSAAGFAAAEQGIRTSVINLQNIVTDSNLLHLLEAGEYNERRVRFSIRKLCEDILVRTLQATGQPKKRIVAELPREEEEFTGDPDLLGSALYHLVENGLLYSLGQVEVGVENQGGELRIVVRDEGPGLSGEQQDLVFQKFVRGTEDPNIAGSGIGLTIVQLIADHLGGQVRIEGGAGFFSTFVFSVPAGNREAA